MDNYASIMGSISRPNWMHPVKSETSNTWYFWGMPITIGEAIKKKVKEDPRTGKAIAASMGMQPGNLNRIYKKESLPSELIARFCVALQHDFFVYVNPFTAEEAEMEMSGNEPIQSSKAKLHKCQKELREAEKELLSCRTDVVDLRDHLQTSREYIQKLKEEINRLT
jgi:peptidoglycan hydrolase CwlO-like protein